MPHLSPWDPPVPWIEHAEKVLRSHMVRVDEFLKQIELVSFNVAISPAASREFLGQVEEILAMHREHILVWFGSTFVAMARDRDSWDEIVPLQQWLLERLVRIEDGIRSARAAIADETA